MPATENEDVVNTFARLREREKQRFRDERKGKIPVMDAETLRELCVDNDGYETPELNDNLYAHFQGFQRIEGLEPYYNLKALWLESNGLTRLENLAPLVSLRCLYLSKNLIERIENLENLRDLNTLDLSENRIKTVAGISCLPQLSSLNLSRNVIESSDDLCELAKCSELSNLDISHNQIDDTRVLDVLKRIPKLRALRITGNEVVSKTKYFRKVYISTMSHLAFLDRPIFPVERAGVEAWAQGGHDAELAAKKAFVNKENEDRKRDLQEFRDWQAQVRERRIREIAEEQARKQEQEKEQNPEASEVVELREEDVDLRGFRGITKQEYIRLSPVDRAVWDARIDAAHEDSKRDRHEVLGDGVAKMGTKFWADEKQKQLARGDSDVQSVAIDVAQEPCPAAEPVPLALLPPPAPVALPTHAPPPPCASSVGLACRPAADSADEMASPAPPRPPVGSPHVQLPPPQGLVPVGDSSASLLTARMEDTEPTILRRDAATFVRDVGDTRRSWAELEQRAREAPFLHRPATLPSVLDDHEEEDESASEAASASATCGGAVPIRALTRAEILRELARGRGQSTRVRVPLEPSTARPIDHVVAPVVTSSAAASPTESGSMTNVSALD